MFLFRSLAIGLLSACVLLLASRPAYEVRIASEPPPVLAAAPPTTATIVDVAPNVPASQLPALIGLAPGEHVVAIGDRAVASDLDAGATLVTSGLRGGSYVDLTIGGGAAGSRRVLVLLH